MNAALNHKYMILSSFLPLVLLLDLVPGLSLSSSSVPGALPSPTRRSRVQLLDSISEEEDDSALPTPRTVSPSAAGVPEECIIILRFGPDADPVRISLFQLDSEFQGKFTSVGQLLDEFMPPGTSSESGSSTNIKFMWGEDLAVAYDPSVKFSSELGWSPAIDFSRETKILDLIQDKVNRLERVADVVGIDKFDLSGDDPEKLYLFPLVLEGVRTS